MSTEDNKTFEAVFGNSNSANGGSDKDARIAELEKKLQSERVESGRVKKLAEELAEAKKLIEEMKAKKSAEDALDAVPENLRADVPEDFLRATGAQIDNIVSRRTSETENAIREIREQMMADKQKQLGEQIRRAFPGFVESIGPGGDKEQHWNKFQQINGPSFQRALSSCDFDAAKFLIESFYQHLGLRVPSGNQSATAAADPRTTGGGANYAQQGDSDSRRYTKDEYLASLNELSNKFNNLHAISYAEYSSERAKLQKALNEGRVG